ncbi:MAG: excalibur calcium-binding domain-containing protein [Acidobacteria bacterium]|nr:excalibur calcium-binding domain-containing protein [Acidobacteriota bacterium]
MQTFRLFTLTASLAFGVAVSSPAFAQKEKKESFPNCKELRKKYPDGVEKGHPAYDPKLDRDKDGRACEPDTKNEKPPKAAP